MSKWTGKRVNVQYTRINEPNFLKKFKKQVGYKEDHGLSDKFADMPEATTEDLTDRDDEKPQIVQLKSGDLTEEEFEAIHEKDKASLNEEASPGKELQSKAKSENELNYFPMINPADIPLPGTITAPPLQLPQETVPEIKSETHIIKPPILSVPPPLLEKPIVEASNSESFPEPSNSTFSNSSRGTYYTQSHSNSYVGNTPQYDKGNTPKVKTTPSWWTPEVEHILQEKKRLSRRYQRTGDFCDLYELKEARVVARRLIRSARYKEYQAQNPDATKKDYMDFRNSNKVKDDIPDDSEQI